MAETILKPKVEAVGVFELVGIGVAKIIEERATAPIIGNGTLTSAAIKGVVGGLAHQYIGNNMLGRIVSGAFLIDAGEDAALSLMNMTGVGASARAESGVNW